MTQPEGLTVKGWVGIPEAVRLGGAPAGSRLKAPREQGRGTGFGGGPCDQQGAPIRSGQLRPRRNDRLKAGSPPPKCPHRKSAG
jgi:hypothetical protein